MIEERLAQLVREALAAGGLAPQGPAPEIQVDRPRQKEFGDFSTNVALALAPRLGRNPREVAEAIVGHLPPADFVTAAEVAGPGFINFRLTHTWLHEALGEVIARGSAYGRAESTGRSVQVEYVSANPTGPLHIGGARNAVIGDALSRLLEATGWRVQREYYFNDAGRQMDLFAASAEARYLQHLGLPAEVPEEGYHGSYLADIAEQIVAEAGDGLVSLPPEERRERILVEASGRVLDGIRATLDRFSVPFDVYFSERTLHDRGEVRKAVETLLERELAYEEEGAVFFRATRYGDEKDRVLIRSNGEPTYFAADCAYLVDKFSRGFDHLIYVWGADHHGTVKRLKGAAEALGYEPSAVEVVLYQMVALLRGGEPVRMSKRAGQLVTLDELIEEVGADAIRFTLLSQSADSTMNFDIEEVKRQSMENPVYYVQYGHARIASILRRAAGRGVEPPPIEEADLSLLATEPELELLRSISEMPEIVREAAESRAPYRLTHYAQDLASRFHRFYTECRVVGDDPALTGARLWLSKGTKQVVANVLALLGVSAPESMERADE